MSARPTVAALLVVLAVCAAPADAHDARPAFLQLTEQPDGGVDVLWKRPILAGGPLAVSLRLPAGWTVVAGTATHRATLTAITERWTAAPGGAPLAGAEVAFEGLDTTGAKVLVRIQATGAVHTTLVDQSEPSVTVARPPTGAQLAGRYTRLGIEHIWFGIDHLLFVLGLLLVVKSRRALLTTITGFTLAHSVTLALAVLGVVAVPVAPVEAVIALSIVFVARELVREHQGEPSLTGRRPWLVAVSFGLLHGFGFAGALSEVGLPAGEVPWALAFFNVGVELGQLAFVAAAGVVIGAVRQAPWSWPAWGWRVAPYAIGVPAAYWVVARTAALGG